MIHACVNMQPYTASLEAQGHTLHLTHVPGTLDRPMHVHVHALAPVEVACHCKAWAALRLWTPPQLSTIDNAKSTPL